MNFSSELLNIIGPLLFFISFFGLITSRNVIKSIVFIIIMQTSVIIFWLLISSFHGTQPPIISPGDLAVNGLDGVADPLPQALMLTAIVIGISVTAIIITVLNALFRKYRSTDWETLEKEASSSAKSFNKEQNSC